MARVHTLRLGEIERVIACDAPITQQQWAALEFLLAYCQFSEGALDERILALPDRAFGRCAGCLYALGWVESSPGFR